MRESLLEKGAALGWSSRRALRQRSFGALQKSSVHRKPNHHAIVRAFKAHLADYRLPEEVIEAYATTFSHSGEFLLLKTESKCAETAIQIVRDCGATRAARHD
jgi:hypothetical protein